MEVGQAQQEQVAPVLKRENIENYDDRARYVNDVVFKVSQSEFQLLIMYVNL